MKTSLNLTKIKIITDFERSVFFKNYTWANKFAVDLVKQTYESTKVTITRIVHKNYDSKIIQEDFRVQFNLSTYEKHDCKVVEQLLKKYRQYII